MSAQVSQRTRFIYAGLAALWLLVVAWQSLEHQRVRRAARTELVNRAKDISSTLGLVIRSQRRFGGFVSRDRIESALNLLIKPGDVTAIALLSDAGEIIASAGAPLEPEIKAMVPSAEYWGAHSVALMNLVDLGTNLTSETDNRNATIVVPWNEMSPFGSNRPPGPPPPGGPGREPPPEVGPRPETPAGPMPDRPPQPGQRGPEAPTSELADGATSSTTNAAARPRGRPRRGEGRFPFNRPYWMSEEEYKDLVQKKGVHSFVLVLPTQSMTSTTRQDLWLRGILSAFAGVSAIGLALAWSNLIRSADLEVRLARAAELNARLKEMNLAAAGLAHETRNPLNIIRGLAQLISKQPAVSPETHERSRDIIAETDRVTAQLNEFINYSRPREVRWSALPLDNIVAEVVRALTSDLEDHDVRVHVMPELPVIRGDEQLLRQALFNLLLNAVQAVSRGGHIEIVGERTGTSDFRLEIRDDGPGVPPEQRLEIFKPYFTTREVGTGLGLAIVQQIVLAHGWEIQCLAHQPKGAIFRLDHLKIAART
ncbi:MAG: hypothetical protein JNK85_10430 [Verrucomicrobiales bacterium]|nr:hypothetical protein [Verrucomicrobiales bacterium]